MTNRNSPPAIASKYDEAKLAVTIAGIELLKTSLIIGFATLMRPMPPVHSMAKNCKILII